MANSADRREAATRHYATAMATINTLLDHADQLRTLLQHIQDATQTDDLLDAARQMIEGAGQLERAVDDLHTAAINAAVYRSKSELARDLATRTGLLFPRPDPADGISASTRRSAAVTDMRRAPALTPDLALDGGATATAATTASPAVGADAEMT